MKEFYRVSEVMEILNLGRTKTYELIRAGVIPSVNIGGGTRVPAKLLHEQIDTIIATCDPSKATSPQGLTSRRHAISSAPSTT
jgi:excisionase family DNA binding protein